MKDQTLIFETDEFSAYKETEAGQEVFDLLDQTEWGTKDTVYQHFGAEEHILHIKDPQFYVLRQGSEFLGCAIFCRRGGATPDHKGHTYYIRFFSASPKVKGKGIVGYFSKEVMEWIRKEAPGSSCFYALTEKRNVRVNKVVESVGFEALTTIKTVGFSRFFPRPVPGVAPLPDAEFRRFMPELEKHFSQHAFWTAENLRADGNYFVLRDEGRIVAGVQVHRGHWRIKNMPGMVGKYVVPILPNIPLFNRVFNADNFRFLSFEAIYVLPGYEHRLQDLFETALHAHGLYSAIYWLDERDPLYETVLKQNRPGLIQQFLGSAEAHFIVSMKDLDDRVKEELHTKPVYVSSYDSL